MLNIEDILYVINYYYYYYVKNAGNQTVKSYRVSIFEKVSCKG